MAKTFEEKQKRMVAWGVVAACFFMTAHVTENPLTMLVSYRGTSTWQFHTGLCKFVQNISTNIWSLGKRTYLKFGEMCYLFISYNITVSWLYTPNGFRIIFSLRDSATQEYIILYRKWVTQHLSQPILKQSEGVVTLILLKNFQ